MRAGDQDDGLHGKYMHVLPLSIMFLMTLTVFAPLRVLRETAAGKLGRLNRPREGE